VDDVELCMEKRLDCELEGVKTVLEPGAAGEDCGREGGKKLADRGEGVVP